MATSPQPQDLITKYKSILANSPSAYTPNVTPTSADVSADASLRQAKRTLKTQEGEALKSRYYPEGDSESRLSENDAPMHRFLKTLGAPASAGAGAVEHLLGKGSKRGFFENIEDNIESQGNYGDIIRSYDVNNAIAAPLGFALDVALDPLAITTGGATGVFGKAAIGAQRAGLKGAAAGAKVGALQKVANTARWTPGLQKRIASSGTQGQGIAPGVYKKVVTELGKADKNYNKVVGDTTTEFLENSTNKLMWLDSVKKADDLLDSDFGRKRNLGDWFRYSPGNWLKNALNKEDEARAFAEGRKQGGVADLARSLDEGDSITAVKKGDDRPMSLSENIRQTLIMGNKPRLAREVDSLNMERNLIGEQDNANRAAEMVQEEISTIGKLLESKPEKLAKFSQLDDKQQEAFAATFGAFKSTVDDYDAKVASVLTNDVTRKILDTYSTYIAAFKTTKVGLNLAARPNAIVGNLAMASMIGVDITSDLLLNSTKKAWDYVRKGKVESLAEFSNDPEWRHVMQEYPETFQSIFGIHPQMILDHESYIANQVAEIAQKFGKDDAAMKNVAEAAEELSMKITKETAEASKKSRSAVETQRALGESTLITDDVFLSSAQRHLDALDKKATDSGSAGLRFLHSALTKPMAEYSTYDQVAKLGLAHHLTKNGITEKELRKIARRFELPPSDVKMPKPGEQDLHFLSPMKAMEIANETFMNYAAMPGAVRVLRSMPLVGSPFASFAYGMSALSAKTIAGGNPAFFNKIQFLLSEISGRQSPLEKEALETEYYQWLDQEGMVKLPMFKENPVYLNMENMLPHYTMNLLQDPNRSYGEKYGGDVAKWIDKSPFFKEPAGQIVLDTLIMPQLIGEAQGIFGQPLWPKDASTGEKAGRIASSAVETLVPPSIGFLGAANVVPDEALPYVPNFRWRQLQNAVQGKSSLGIPSREPAAQRSLRVMAAMAGLPTYQANLSFAERKANQKK